MARLYQRTYKLVLGTSEITEMHIRFRVEKSLKKEPNTSTISVFNLSPSLRESLEKAKTTPVRLEAGYGGENSLLFLGQVRSATSTTQGPDIITTVEGTDGETAIQGARVAISVPPKTSPKTILEQIAGGFGAALGLGNVSAFADKIQGQNLFPGGKVITGSASQAMDALTGSAGLSWSVQDGKLQVIDKKDPLDGLAFELTSDSGLVGSPSVDSKGVVNFQCLLMPNMRPGALAVFKTRSINGGYRLQKVTYTGDFAGQEWYVEGEATKF